MVLPFAKSPHRRAVQVGQASPSVTEEDITRLSCWNTVLCALPHSRDIGNSHGNAVQEPFNLGP